MSVPLAAGAAPPLPPISEGGAGAQTAEARAGARAQAPGSSGREAQGPMLYLRDETCILAEELSKRLEREPPLEGGGGGEDGAGAGEDEPADVIVTDFDEAKLRLEVPEEALHLVRVSIKLPGAAFADMERAGLGAHARLAAVYGTMLLAEPHDGADATVVVDRRALAAPVAEVVSKVANLRRHLLSWPYLRLMRAVAEGRGAAEKPFCLRLSAREPIFLLARADRVVVIFHLAFEEPTDRAVARIIAQELTEANRAVNNAPPCSWSERDVPLELKTAFAADQVPRPADDAQSIGYMTFSVFPGSFKTEAQRESIAAHLALFRPYLTYHLKAAKSYLHARMRARTETLQRVLNRAIPDSEAPKVMTLASGKSFVRK
jgi:actin related protein 2/3 complex subunit 2